MAQQPIFADMGLGSSGGERPVSICFDMAGRDSITVEGVAFHTLHDQTSRFCFWLLLMNIGLYTAILHPCLSLGDKIGVPL